MTSDDSLSVRVIDSLNDTGIVFDRLLAYDRLETAFRDDPELIGRAEEFLARGGTQSGTSLPGDLQADLMRVQVRLMNIAFGRPVEESYRSTVGVVTYSSPSKFRTLMFRLTARRRPNSSS